MPLPILVLLHLGRSRKINQGNQDGSLLVSYRRKGSRGEDSSSGWRMVFFGGASHSSGATGQTLYTPPTGGGMEALTCPLSGQESQTTNKRFYLAAGYLSYKRALL